MKKLVKPKKKLVKNPRGAPENLKPFRKGDPNIPKSPGRPPIPPEEKEARELVKGFGEKLVKRLIAEGVYEARMEQAIEIASKNGNIAPIKYLNDLVGATIEDKDDKGKQIVIQTMNIF